MNQLEVWMMKTPETFYLYLKKYISLLSWLLIINILHAYLIDTSILQIKVRLLILYDYFSFVYFMIYGERRRIKRILILIGLGGALIFLILNTSQLLKQYITSNYTHIEVIMPINKHTHEPVISLNYPLLNPYLIQELNTTLPDTTLSVSPNATEIEVNVLKTNQTLTLSVLFSEDYNQILIHPYLSEMYDI